MTLPRPYSMSFFRTKPCTASRICFVPLLLHAHFEGGIVDLEVGYRRAEDVLVDAHLAEEERFANGANIGRAVAEVVKRIFALSR